MYLFFFCCNIKDVALLALVDAVAPADVLFTVLAELLVDLLKQSQSCPLVPSCYLAASCQLVAVLLVVACLLQRVVVSVVVAEVLLGCCFSYFPGCCHPPNCCLFFARCCYLPEGCTTKRATWTVSLTNTAFNQ